MLNHVIRRLFLAIPILWGVFTVTFILLYSVPGVDPARLLLGQRTDVQTVQEIRAQLGLDDPKIIQSGRFLWKIVRHGDLGRSFVTDRPVLEAILERLPATAILGISSLALGVFFGMIAGTFSALYHNRFVDNFLRVISLVFAAAPFFLLAVFLQYLFGWRFHILPVAGYITGPHGIQHLILPMVAMAIYPFAGMTRLTRYTVLDVLNQDYMRTAEAKGLPVVYAVIRHGVRNALIAIVTAFSASLAGVLAGAFFVEYVFAWPGIGLLAVDAINNRDVPMVQGTVLFAAFLFVIADIFADVAYAWLDPRVTYS